MSDTPLITEHFWLLDLRGIWNGDKIANTAPEALRLLSQEEQDKANRFYFLRDGKLSVGSSLLKRLYAVKSLGFKWPAVELTRKDNPKHGKPAIKPAEGNEAPVDFNVSHQAGLVALAGCSLRHGLLGVDITCAGERNDKRAIDRDGFEGWIDMHEHVFSTADLDHMKEKTPNLDLDAKIRRFYAYWCLKEAYVKLEGEALLAGWLKDVEFRNVQVPQAAPSISSPDDQAWGQRVSNIQVWFKGTLRQDVTMVLQAFGSSYMIGTAIKHSPDALALDPSYIMLQPEEDIYPFASEA